MAIIVDEENKVVTVENQPDAPRAMFPNLQEGGGGVSDIQINGQSIVGADGVVNFAPVEVSGTTPAITAQAGSCYICGECATLNITMPESGCIDVVFISGTTPTVLTITPPAGQTVLWTGGFDPTSLDANTTYELNIYNNLGVASTWT